MYNGHGDSLFDFVPLWGVSKKITLLEFLMDLRYFRASLDQLDHYFGPLRTVRGVQLVPTYPKVTYRFVLLRGKFVLDTL